jgi:hypothetical protein
MFENFKRILGWEGPHPAPKNTASRNEDALRLDVPRGSRSTNPRPSSEISLSRSSINSLRSAASLERCAIICEENLPSELNIKHMGATAALIPTRISIDGKPEFRVADIRRNRTVRIQQDGGDGARKEITSLFKQPEVIDFFTPYFNGERRYAAGIQFHSMGEGAVLREHKHGADDIFVIFHFDHNYEGGKYFERHDDMLWYPPLTPFCACVSHSAVPHGVDVIESGTRSVLVTSWERSEYKR